MGIGVTVGVWVWKCGSRSDLLQLKTKMFHNAPSIAILHFRLERSNVSLKVARLKLIFLMLQRIIRAKL